VRDRTGLDAAADLADEHDIRRLVDAYALAADRADGDALAALFTHDGELLVFADPASPEPTGIRRGHDEIAAAISSLARYRATLHVVASHLADVDGDRALAEGRCIAHHVTAAADGLRDRVLFIRYVDTFERSDAGWRFRRREVRVELADERALSGE
jgi:ketosteroid isomerase-like protein